MKFTFLGTGTSHGIPRIGCSCGVCTSADPRNRRRRCSLYVVTEGRHLIFDNNALISHRAMAAVLGAVLRLPPIKRSLAVGQMGSRYVEKLIEWNQA